MSVRLSIAFPRACSGLMYEAVPMMAPSAVSSRHGRRVRYVQRSRVGRDGFRQTEVQDLDLVASGQFDVRGLQIAVNDPLLMRRF